MIEFLTFSNKEKKETVMIPKENFIDAIQTEINKIVISYSALGKKKVYM